MVWPMQTDDDYGDVTAKELKAALVGCRVEGRGLERLEVKEVVQTTIHNEGKDARVLRSTLTLESKLHRVT